MKTITSIFVRKPRSVHFDATDSNGTGPQIFDLTQLRAWLMWHLDREMVLRLTVETTLPPLALAAAKRDAQIRYDYDHGRSVRNIATGHFLPERAVRESLARTITPPESEADVCPACGQKRCDCGPGSAA